MGERDGSDVVPVHASHVVGGNDGMRSDPGEALPDVVTFSHLVGERAAAEGPRLSPTAAAPLPGLHQEPR